MHTVMIIGFNELARKLASYLEEDIVNTRIIGYCEDEKKVKELSGYPVFNSIDKVIELSEKHAVNEIYSTISPENDCRIYDIIEYADQSCIHFRLIPDISCFIKKPMQIRFLKDLPILIPKNEKLFDWNNRIKKRVLDIIISSIVILFILSWLIPILAIIIFIDSKGPIFFVQERTGRKNKTFSCIKFRSMRINEESNSVQATRYDPRITTVGRFLRSTNLDELPQFFNVLKGDMSLVGPRPHMLKHTDDYSKLIKGYMVRHFIQPGITGWAQVNGYRGETKRLEQMKKRIEHDMWYIDNWNLWLDMRIILLTVYIMFKGDKNAF